MEIPIEHVFENREGGEDIRTKDLSHVTLPDDMEQNFAVNVNGSQQIEYDEDSVEERRERERRRQYDSGISSMQVSEVEQSLGHLESPESVLNRENQDDGAPIYIDGEEEEEEEGRVY